MIWNFLKKHYLILTILIVALILRFIGIFYGYPLSLVYDETPSLSAALKMIGTQSLRANAFQYYYPAGLAYIYLPFLGFYLIVTRLLGIFGSVADMKEAVLLNLGAFIPVIRAVSALLGAASVFLIYRIAEKLFACRPISLISAWLLATSFFHVANSHYGQTWTAQTFFILLVLLWSVHLRTKVQTTWRDYLSAGIFIGLAFSINFVGILSYFWFLLVHFLKNKSQKFSRIFIVNRNFWLTNIVLLLMIGLVYYLNPFGLNNYFGRIFNSSPTIKSYSLFSLASLQILLAYLKNGFLQESVLFLLAIPASIVLWRQNKIVFYFLVPWIVSYYFLLAPLTNPMTRYLLPLIPLLAILAANLLYSFWQKISPRQPRFLIILLFIFSLLSFIPSILYDFRMTKADTRVLAYHWVRQNIPADSTIKNFHLGVELPLIENRAIVQLVKEKFPALYSSQRKYLLSLPADRYPAPSYFVVNYPELVDDNQSFDYLILSNFDKNKLSEHSASLSKAAKLVAKFYPTELSSADDQLWPDPSVLQVPFNNYTFNPFSLYRSYPFYGPYVEIYQLNKNN